VESVWAGIIGAGASGVVGALIALFAFWLQNRATLAAERRAATERANVVRTCLAAEIEILLAGIAPILDWKDEDAGAAAVAMSALGALKVRVYPEVISQIGALGSGLAGQIVGLYANLELLIERGQEIERDASGLFQTGRLNDTAGDWIGRLQIFREAAVQTLTELRKAP